MRIRILGPGDEAALEAFLAHRAEATLMLRSNLRAGGLLDRGQRFQGTWAAAEDSGRISAVAALFWNGILIVHAPAHLAHVVRAAVEATSRPLAGLSGEPLHVDAGLEALGDRARKVRNRFDEDLFVLELAQLRIPGALLAKRVACRPVRSADLDELASWRAAYLKEALHDEDSLGLLERARAAIEAEAAGFGSRVLEEAGRLVAYTAFNARTADAVGVGGVYTPTDLRGRGYARCAVAGHLLAARDQGLARSVLIAVKTNEPARRAYLALGYAIVGEMSLVFLDAERPVFAAERNTLPGEALR